METAEAIEAYRQIGVPCIVEHAGLVFDGYDSYPGGLTKPMWDFLGDEFVRETGSGGRRASARAVIAYCDGASVMTFEGETRGSISAVPRGSRRFYWDTIFIPDNTDGSTGTRTYAEIVEDGHLGLKYKVVHLSQSSRAMLKFLEYRRGHTPGLWSNI